MKIKKDIIIYGLLLLLFIICFKQQEKIENFKAINDHSIVDEVQIKKAVDSLYTNKIEDYVKDNIQRIYKTDVDSIRNLEKLSKLLQSGGYTVAGDLTIKGDLKCEKNLDVKGKGNIANEFYSKTINSENLNASKTIKGKNLTTSETIKGKNLTATDSTNGRNLTATNIKGNNLTATNTIKGKNLTATGTLSASNFNSKVSSYLKNRNFKFKAKSSYDGVVWSNLLPRGDNKERGLAARKGSSGDWFTFKEI